jgi:transcriptional regulator with XRE-family HTH domain
MTGFRRELDAEIGRRVRGRRKALKLSQPALARAVGVSARQVQKYEAGLDAISFAHLVDIAATLDCRVFDLVGNLRDIDASATKQG